MPTIKIAILVFFFPFFIKTSLQITASSSSDLSVCESSYSTVTYSEKQLYYAPTVKAAQDGIEMLHFYVAVKPRSASALVNALVFSPIRIPFRSAMYPPMVKI